MCISDWSSDVCSSDLFMAALAEQMMKSAENGAMQPMDPNAQMLRPQDLQDLVERAREMAKTGAREAAADLLAQLQQMLENLQEIGRASCRERGCQYV